MAAGLELIVIPLLLQGDQLCTDMPRLKAEVQKLGSSQIVAVLSTTSCFAPRAADSLVEIAKFCQEANIGHVVNNAYGVQVNPSYDTDGIILGFLFLRKACFKMEKLVPHCVWSSGDLH